MAYYRLYLLDRSSGRIREFREFEARDDLAAIRRSEHWRSGPMELWCLDRRVRRWQPMLPPPPQALGSAASLYS